MAGTAWSVLEIGRLSATLVRRKRKVTPQHILDRMIEPMQKVCIDRQQLTVFQHILLSVVPELARQQGRQRELVGGGVRFTLTGLILSFRL